MIIKNGILAYAFCGCSSLEFVKASKKLKEIGAYAFAKCRNLNNVDFSNTSLKKITESSFYLCDSLRKVSLPEDTLHQQVAAKRPC